MISGNQLYKNFEAVVQELHTNWFKSLMDVEPHIAAKDVQSIDWALVQYDGLSEDKFIEFMYTNDHLIDWAKFCKIDVSKFTEEIWLTISYVGILTDEFMIEHDSQIDWPSVFTISNRSPIAEEIYAHAADDQYDCFEFGCPNWRKGFPSLEIIKRYLPQEEVDISLLTCYLLAKGLNYSDILGMLDIDVLTYNKILIDGYGHQVDWELYFQEDRYCQDDLQTYLINEYRNIDWDEFIDECDESIDYMFMIHQDYEMAKHIPYHMQWDAVQVKGERNEQLHKEFFEYMYHPVRVQKWIEQGNDLEDYLA